MNHANRRSARPRPWTFAMAIAVLSLGAGAAPAGQPDPDEAPGIDWIGDLNPGAPPLDFGHISPGHAPPSVALSEPEQKSALRDALLTRAWVSKEGTDPRLEDGNAIAVDAAGRAVTVGWRRNAGTDQDGIVTKHDVDGKVLWTVTLKGGTALSLFSVALDPAGNVYAAGTDSSYSPFTSRGFLAKLDPDGKVLWERRYASPDPAGTLSVAGVASGPLGPVVAGPHTLRTPVLRPELLVRQLDPDGNVVWSASIFEGRSTNGWSVSLDALGNAYTAAATAAIDAAGKVVRENVLFKIDRDGKVIARTVLLSGPASFVPFNVRADAAGAVTVAGYEQRSPRVPSSVPFIARVDAFGSVSWLKVVETADRTIYYSLALDVAGNPVAVGYYHIPDPGGATRFKAYVHRYDSAGRLLWDLTHLNPQTNHEDVHGVAVDPQGAIYLTGGEMDPSNPHRTRTLKLRDLYTPIALALATSPALPPAPPS